MRFADPRPAGDAEAPAEDAAAGQKRTRPVDTFEGRELSKLQLPVLRRLARAARVPISGNKPDLVERLLAWSEPADPAAAPSSSSAATPPPAKKPKKAAKETRNQKMARLMTYSVKDLLEMCRRAGVKSGGAPKAELIARLMSPKKHAPKVRGWYF